MAMVQWHNCAIHADMIEIDVSNVEIIANENEYCRLNVINNYEGLNGF